MIMNKTVYLFCLISPPLIASIYAFYSSLKIIKERGLKWEEALDDKVYKTHMKYLKKVMLIVFMYFIFMSFTYNELVI